MMTINDFKNALPPQMAKTVNQELVDFVNTSIADQEAMEMFKEHLVTYTSVLQQGKFKLSNYINAVKYVTFKLMGYSNKRAYVSTFPDKYQNFMHRGIDEKDIASYITAYNKSKLVNLIYAQTEIPIYVLNAPARQRAINRLVWLMENSKSDMVQFQSANGLLTHLKPPEAAKVELDVKVGTNDTFIQDMEAAMYNMVNKQRELIQQGGNLHQIVNAPINISPGVDIIDAVKIIDKESC